MSLSSYAVQIKQKQLLKNLIMGLMTLPLVFASLFGLWLHSVANAAEIEVVNESFDAYDGADASAPTPWVFSNIGNYTTAGSSGVSPNSLQFNSSASVAEVELPLVAGQTAKSLSFWVKSNSASASSTFMVSESPDGSTWSLLDQYAGSDISGSSAGETKTLGLSADSEHVRFSYIKDEGNIALDDVLITADEADDDAPYVFPSTNADNKIAGAPHVNLVSVDSNEITLEFKNPKGYSACFEYRTDGDTSQVIGTNPPDYPLEERYPYFCLVNESKTETFTPAAYIEVRLAFGAERDHDFDWTRFDLLPPPVLPDAPTLLTPADGSFFTTADLPVAQDWTSPAGAVSYIYESCSVDPGTDDCPAGQIVHTTTTTQSKRSIGVTAPEGAFWWHVKAVDADGNESEWSQAWKATVDNTSPTKPQLLGFYKGHGTPSGDLIACGGHTNTTEIRIVWAANPEDDISHYWFGTRTNSRHRKVTKTYYNGDMNPAKAPFYYTVIAVDHAGNESAISEPCPLTLDTVAPVVDITSHTDGQYVSGVVNLVGQVYDENPMNSYFRIEGSGGYVETDLYTDGRTVHEFAWDTGAVADGVYHIYFEARDKADNKLGSRSHPNDSVKVITLEVDNTAPLTDAGSDDQVTGLTYTLDGAVSDTGSGVTETKWSLVSGPGTADFGDDSAEDTTVQVSDYGEYVFSLRATDAQGNQFEDIVVITFEEPAAPARRPIGGGQRDFVPVAFNQNADPDGLNDDQTAGDDGQALDDEQGDDNQTDTSSTSTGDDSEVEGASTEGGSGSWLQVILAFLVLGVLYYLFFVRRNQED